MCVQADCRGEASIFPTDAGRQRLVTAVERMRSLSITACPLLLAALAGTSGNVSASTRRDVASTYLVCSAVGEPLADLRAAHSAAGVFFEELSPGTVRVGRT